MSRTNFHGPKDVRAIDVRLFLFRTSELIKRVIKVLPLLR